MASINWRAVTFGASARSAEISLGSGDIPTGQVYFPLGNNPRALSVEVYDRSVLILQSKSIPAVEALVDVPALVYKTVYEGMVFEAGQQLKNKILSSSGGLVLSVCQSPVSPTAFVVWVGINPGEG